MDSRIMKLKATWLLGLLAGQSVWAQVTPIFTNAHPQPTLQNLVGTYFNNMYLTNAVFSRNDGTINFNWAFGSPDPRINSDNFSVRWVGQLVPSFEGTYTFTATSDDGIRVWIDGQLIIDSWVDQAQTDHTNSFYLTAGVRHDLKVEYYENTGAAVAALSWSGPETAKEIVGSPPYPDGTGDGFGTVLTSIGGGQFAVGAPLFDVYVGAFGLFPDDGRGWLGDLAGTVSVLPGSPYGFFVGTEKGFGASLSVRGDGGLLIGCPRFQTGCGIGCFVTNSGAVFLGGGSSSAYAFNPSGLAYSFFGAKVVGLPGNQWAASTADGNGKVYLFAAQTITATITNPGTGSGFPSAMCALGTNRLLISSTLDSVAGDNAGSVFIYDLSGNVLKKIHNTGGSSADGFGAALAVVDDHRFLIGASKKSVVYVNSSNQQATNPVAGVVYLYNDTGVSGTRLLTLTPPDPSSANYFGSSISLLGPGRILIGSPQDKIGAVFGGQVYLFTLDGLHLETIRKANPASGDNFGLSVCALDERRFIVGAPGDSTRAPQAGAIYGFDAPIPSADLGAEIPQPENLDTSGNFKTLGPTVLPAGAALWHVPSQKLFAVKPGGILVTWPLTTADNHYNWQASITWPTNSALYQVHIAGQTPIDLTSSGNYSNVVLEATTTDADPAAIASNRTFSASFPGTSFLLLSSSDPSSNAIRFQFVRSITWNDSAYLYDDAPATVGQPIADPGGFHDPAAGSPEVVLASGAYCPAPVFIPATRTGTIIPVNSRDPSNPAHDLVVGFYQRGTLLYDPVTGLSVSNNIFWPYKPVRFDPQWPTNAPHLVVASEQGTGAIDPAQYVNWDLYYQNDPTLPGFNPNDEHALRLPVPGTTGLGVFALRSDLGTPQTSQPFVLIRYQDPASGGQWRMKLWQVVAQEAPWSFQRPATAGLLLQPPYPLNLSLLGPSPQTIGVSGPYWQDRKLFFWAKAAGNDGGHADIVMHFFYLMHPSFFYPGTNPPPVGASVPFLDLAAGTPGTPIDVDFDTVWPALLPELRLGETLVTLKNGLPDIKSQDSVEVVYQQAQALGQGSSVKLIDPTREYHVPLATAPAAADNNGIFQALPATLQSRFYYDKVNQWLRFKGQFIQPAAGEYYLLLNVLTGRELNSILALSSDPAFQQAVNNLAAVVTNLTEISPNASNFDSMALSAGQASAPGYVTVAFANSTNLPPAQQGDPISLAVLKVACPPYRGEIKIPALDPAAAIQSVNPFDERLTLRHSGDFAGKPESYIFDWRAMPPQPDGSVPPGPYEQWPAFPTQPGNGQGAVDITISGPGLFTLSDNFFVCRYKPVANPLCANASNVPGWSDWTAPMIAPGWISRVLAGINPFDSRVQSYQNSTANTVVSMISQAGKPYGGPIALNGQNANSFGLIETYETVLRRGEDLSINGSPPVNYGPANDELLRVAGQLSDLYMLLGNEAFADAEDPTIAFGTSDQTYGAEATSIHCFMNQTASLMEEELDLLRGRDDTKLPSAHSPPVYNRLTWNFTQGVDGGEVAYALNYNIRPATGNVSGTISAADAAALYPQGHGDAWGHYLSALKNYYRLLRNPNFTWVPTVDTILVSGQPLQVGYEHERKFAAAAAARARAGAEIVNLTYRNAYVEDPAGQWQGYTDTDTNRAWGVSEWGSRAGQGAFFDWVTANALLPPVDSDPTHTGIQKVDRTTISEIRDIVSALGDIQTKVDQADSGLNPLGLAKNVVPFDIDPNLISQGQTHFEQIYNRAVTALNNAIAVFNRANNCTQLLRQQADTVSDFQKKVTDQEADFDSRLIEIFGYPYAEDIGAGGAYPTGYIGPDIYHFNYVDGPTITGETNPPTQTMLITMRDIDVGPDGSPVYTDHTVAYNLSSQSLSLVKPAGWTSRQAPGQIQMAYSDLLQAYTRFQKALTDYNNLLSQIGDRANLLNIQYAVAANEIQILYQNEGTQEGLDQHIEAAKKIADMDTLAAKKITLISDAQLEALPKVVGIATDPSGGFRAIIKTAEAVAALHAEEEAAGAQQVQMQYEHDKEIASLQEQIFLTANKDQAELTADLQQFVQLVRQESSMRLELFNADEVLQQTVGRYSAAVASGQRLLDDRLRFRQETAAQVQQYRYKDMAFRIFRNDALQKYRAQFDLAAMYVYLSARAYDYETNLKKGDPRGPGSDFMTSIVRAQALGIIQNGLPQTGPASGDAGLSDPMARMNLNWQLVLKGQLGFNNPQIETGRFSLRSELFRVQASSGGSKTWRDTLTGSVVDNLLTLPEFKRFCIPFQPQLAAEPAIVIPFATTINFGENFFGWPLAPGDSTYDSTHFATKVRSVGVWFANYNNTALSSTPHVYLFPVGEDVMRSPSSDVGDIRQWKIIDQALPVPFPLSSASLNDPSWFPGAFGSGDQFTEPLENLRQYPEFRAYNDSGTFDPTQVISNNRLIGRSVWNTRWLLIIPAGELLADRNEAIQRFINGSLLPNGTRDGNGVSDIKIFFQTYAYSGN